MKEHNCKVISSKKNHPGLYNVYFEATQIFLILQHQGFFWSIFFGCVCMFMLMSRPQLFEKSMKEYCTLFNLLNPTSDKA